MIQNQQAINDHQNKKAFYFCLIETRTRIYSNQLQKSSVFSKNFTLALDHFDC
jgi:hypothetical protein